MTRGAAMVNRPFVGERQQFSNQHIEVNRKVNKSSLLTSLERSSESDERITMSASEVGQ